jgi:hypothetical protein
MNYLHSGRHGWRYEEAVLALMHDYLVPPKT